MSQAKIIINVNNVEQPHSNGLSGHHIVPACKPGQAFAMLVVYPTPEIQDIGDQRRVMHWLKAEPLARDIVGLRSDAAAHSHGSTGTKEKWGLLLCEAEPDVPKELIRALEEEVNFLNSNPPDVKMRKDTASGAVVAVNIEAPEVKAKKIELSARVEQLRHEFEEECRKLVQKTEIQKAKRALLVEDQRLVVEGDMMWAKGEGSLERRNINELHREACKRLGREKPWCYLPEQLVSCPGCGSMIKEDILTCPQCSGWLDEGIEGLRSMKPKERAQKMYPERYGEPVAASGKKG
jgi:hypothetical protein